MNEVSVLCPVIAIIASVGTFRLYALVAKLLRAVWVVTLSHLRAVHSLCIPPTVSVYDMTSVMPACSHNFLSIRFVDWLHCGGGGLFP